MKFSWCYESDYPQTVKLFLKEQNIPRKFVSFLKFSNGRMLVNRQEVTVRYLLQKGDELVLEAPDEASHETVPPSFAPIEIVYEDRDVLVLNKPVDVVSIPSRKAPDTAMANRVKGYYIQQGYSDQVIHIVTRLDRQTSGLMLIAKHRLAHALLDQQIQAKGIEKIYYAISSRSDWQPHGVIEAPIARCGESIITRQVHESGQYARTEYWLEQSFHDSSLLRLQLHTGRTHQIRVHLTHEGGVLVGDDLYGGRLEAPIMRQALHCGELKFRQPFTQEVIHLHQALPEDMATWVAQRTK
ncbi:MAG: RluA family pseudouridine synthase [Aerococcaceae bacterium]|nr:RluA family pseudouridine synthase [Aerococcaceae bacterium]